MLQAFYKHAMTLGMFCFSFAFVMAQNKPAVLSNIRTGYDAPNQRYVVQYDLFDNEERHAGVALKLIDKKSKTILGEPAACKGDIGNKVATGKNRKISFECLPGDKNRFQDVQLMLIADDHYTVKPEELIKQVDTLLVKKNLEFICGERNDRSEKARVHKKKVHDSIVSYFNAQQLNTYEQKISDDNQVASNIIGDKDGLADSAAVFIVCAHYDTVAGSPGADDNASGVAGIMELIRILSQYNFGHTIRFIAFDMEENEAYGSRQYLKIEPDNAISIIKGVIDYDMIGYYSAAEESQQIPTGFDILFPDSYKKVASDKFRGDFMLLSANEPSEFIAREFMTSGREYVPSLEIIPLIAEGNGESAPALSMGDHGSFWAKKIPAIHIGDGTVTRNPHYHQNTDLPGSINYKFMGDIIRATLVAVARLSKINHSTYAVTNFMF